MLTELPKAILFDMDGTLTEPLLDFPRIRAEMGIDGRHIVEALERMGPVERRRAEAILHRHEEQAALASRLNRGCAELIEWLAGRRIALAVITLNSRHSAQTVLERHGLRIDTIVTREDGLWKPHPDPLLRACARLGVAVESAWMVGDGRYDVQAGNAAGARTVWISHGRTRDFDALPWRTVADLCELAAMLKREGEG